MLQVILRNGTKYNTLTVEYDVDTNHIIFADMRIHKGLVKQIIVL
jgi:hypothetical protein